MARDRIERGAHRGELGRVEIALRVRRREPAREQQRVALAQRHPLLRAVLEDEAPYAKDLGLDRRFLT
jgi:hypothetical protein